MVTSSFCFSIINWLFIVCALSLANPSQLSGAWREHSVLVICSHQKSQSQGSETWWQAECQIQPTWFLGGSKAWAFSYKQDKQGWIPWLISLCVCIYIYIYIYRITRHSEENSTLFQINSKNNFKDGEGPSRSSGNQKVLERKRVWKS